MKTWERWPLLLVLLAVWGGLWAAGFPAPHGIDDLCYVDASINLAETGKLQAPALERSLAKWHTLDYYLVPPFYNYLLGGWLALFGIGTASLLACYAACATLSSWALWRLLCFFGLGAWTCAFSLLVYVPYLLSYCLRPEPIGLALLLPGLLCLGSRRRGALFAGFLLAGLAVGCAVNLLPIAVAFSLAVLAVRYRSGSVPLRVALSEAVVAGGLAFLAFLFLFAVLIRFHFHDFLVQFLDEIHSRRGGPLYLGPVEFVSYLLQYWRPVLYLPGFAGLMAAGFLTWRGPGRALPERVRWWIAGCCALVLMGIFYRPGNLQGYGGFGWMALLAFFTAATWRLPVRAAGAAAVVGFWLLSQSLTMVSLVVGKPVDRQACARLRTELAGHPGRLVIDDFAARYVFDFHLPPGALDVGYLRPLPAFWPTVADKREGETWVCSTYILNLYTPTLLEEKPPSIRIFGRTFNLPLDPGQMRVIP